MEDENICDVNPGYQNAEKAAEIAAEWYIKDAVKFGFIPDEEVAKKCLKDRYEEMIKIYEYYLDWDIKEIKLQCIWNIGTYFYELFTTYPYKFITAMKGSGKTRLLRLSKSMTYKGILTAGMSDSALFRNAHDHTLLFDEMESIGKKEKQTQREILNAGYKKGINIIRTKEVRTKEGKDFVNEEFIVYGPKMLANIWGMENVLGDRCIFSVLERSNNPIKTKLIEDFDTNPDILAIKHDLNELKCRLCRCSSFSKCIHWNTFVKERYTTTYTTHTTLHTYTTQEETLFNKINDSEIEGRYLELYFPLFIIANELGDEVLDEIIEIAREKVVEKKETEVIESIDIALFEYISQLNPELKFIHISKLTDEFRLFFQANEDFASWLNPLWMSRALKRLGLIIQKRRVGRGVEAIVNVTKAIEKLRMFKK